MHAFDQLIALANLSGVLDLRCQLQGDWMLEHPPLAPGQASYHLILGGECRLQRDGESPLPLQAGDIVLLPRSQAHTLTAGQPDARSMTALRREVRPGRITRLYLGQAKTGLDMLCGRIHYSPGATLLAALPEVLVARTDAPSLAALTTLMRQEAEDEGLASQSVVDGLSVILFTLVLRQFCEQQGPLSGVLALLRDRRLAKVALALLNDLSQPWPIEALAAQANLSRSAFMRAFTAACQAAPATLVMQLRMERAQHLLQRSLMPISDIAFSVGYPNLSSFSRAFKQHTGLAPAHYRQHSDTAEKRG